MAIVSPAGPGAAADRRRALRGLLVREMWAALAVCVIWLVVLVDALAGPDIVSSSAGSFTRVPSAVVLAFFAWLATWVVARHGFGRREDDAG